MNQREKEFIKYAVSLQYEPFSFVRSEIPEGCKIEKAKITRVSPESCGSVTIVHKGGGFSMPMLRDDQPMPRKGDDLELLLESFSVIQGIAINGGVIFWRNQEQVASYNKRIQENAHWSLERSRQIFVPDFSLLKNFTLKKGEEVVWRKNVKVNSDDPYGFEVMRYASAWANYMEEAMSSGKSLKRCAQEASKKADTGGITGFMYGAAVATLAQVWKHGDALREWHNKETAPNQADEANEKKQVLNPALWSIGTSP